MTSYSMLVLSSHLWELVPFINYQNTRALISTNLAEGKVVQHWACCDFRQGTLLWPPVELCQWGNDSCCWLLETISWCQRREIGRERVVRDREWGARPTGRHRKRKCERVGEGDNSDREKQIWAREGNVEATWSAVVLKWVQSVKPRQSG